MLLTYSILLFIVFAISYSIYKIYKTDSFEEYINKNPNNFEDNQISCVNCNHTTQFVKKMSFGYFGHFCKQCGSLLYHTKRNFF